MLLQIIVKMNVHLAQPLLHLSPNSVVNLVQMSTDGSDSSLW